MIDIFLRTLAANPADIILRDTLTADAITPPTPNETLIHSSGLGRMPRRKKRRTKIVSAVGTARCTTTCQADAERLQRPVAPSKAPVTRPLPAPMPEPRQVEVHQAPAPAQPRGQNNLIPTGLRVAQRRAIHRPTAARRRQDEEDVIMALIALL